LAARNAGVLRWGPSDSRNPAEIALCQHERMLDIVETSPPAFECPKHMEYGPCGGVKLDGSCEVSEQRCVFLEVPTVRWHGIERDARARVGGSALESAAPQSATPQRPTGSATPASATPQRPAPQSATPQRPTPASATPQSATPLSATPIHPDPTPEPVPSAGAAPMRELLAMRQIVVADFPARAIDAGSIERCASDLVGNVDAVLAGDSGAARVQFSPSYRAHLIRATGLAVWTGFNCRDRNRVAMEGELAGLAHVGVSGVHCVTGDHTLTGSRPDAAPVFDLDSTEAASLARAAGHLVSVAESPAAPPTGNRPARLVEKMRAGAEVCFVNHAGGAGPVRDFISRTQDVISETQELRADLAYIPCIPVVVDRESAELLLSFTTLVLPEGYIERIVGAADPFTEGIAAAIDLGHDFLALDGVRGVNLSGGAGAGREQWFAEALARISTGLAVA
jgi:5,10-methylenetetrahydrofolate reductase